MSRQVYAAEQPPQELKEPWFTESRSLAKGRKDRACQVFGDKGSKICKGSAKGVGPKRPFEFLERVPGKSGKCRLCHRLKGLEPLSRQDLRQGIDKIPIIRLMQLLLSVRSMRRSTSSNGGDGRAAHSVLWRRWDQRMLLIANLVTLVLVLVLVLLVMILLLMVVLLLMMILMLLLLMMMMMMMMAKVLALLLALSRVVVRLAATKARAVEHWCGRGLTWRRKGWPWAKASSQVLLVVQVLWR